VLWAEDHGTVSVEFTRAHTIKHPTDELVTLTLRVRSSKFPHLQGYTESLETEEDRSSSIAEVFHEYLGREQEVALQA
jgi:hypothetical protein